MSNSGRWRKSGYSGTGGNCVELAGSMDRVRDSKNPSGRSLRADLVAFVRDVKADRITR